MIKNEEEQKLFEKSKKTYEIAEMEESEVNPPHNTFNYQFTANHDMIDLTNEAEIENQLM